MYKRETSHFQQEVKPRQAVLGFHVSRLGNASHSNNTRGLQPRPNQRQMLAADQSRPASSRKLLYAAGAGAGAGAAAGERR